MKLETSSYSSHDVMPGGKSGNPPASPGIIIPSVLFAVSVLTRLPFTSKMLYNMDSVQFALAMQKFDVALHQPQPPGYYLYVLLGRAAAMLFGDANTALVAVSIFFGGLVTVMLYILAFELFGNGAALAAAAIGITSPQLWHHGEVALSYLPEAFMSLSVAWLCLKAIRGERGYIIAASFMLGIAGGVRQNTMVFLTPLWLFALYRTGPRRAAVPAAVFAATVAAWFIPMLAETGGYERYSAALRAHWLDSNWRGIHLHWVLFNARYMAYFLLSGLVLAVVPLAVYCIDMLRGRTAPSGRDTVLFFALWIAPALMFHLIIFTHPAVPGHSLIYLVGLIVLSAGATGHAAGRLAGAMTRLSASTLRAVLAAVIASANLLFFLFSQNPPSAGSIALHDRSLARYIAAVGSSFSPEDTVIIGSNRFFYSYRHAMYYLPGFKVYDGQLLTTPDGPMLFWGKDRRTHRARYMEPEPWTRRFVDFMNYDARFDKEFPPGAIVTNIGEGSLLVHYDNASYLSGVERLSPILRMPAGGGG